MRPSLLPRCIAAGLLWASAGCSPRSQSADSDQPEVVGAATVSDTLSYFKNVTEGEADYPQEPAKRVLFVGNSFTFGNDVPRLVAELGLSRDPPLRLDVRMVARDGMTLERHWREGDVARHLGAERWDVVVLQEQGSRPLSDPARMETYARRLAALARAAGAEVILFQTWARLDQPETEEPRAAAYRRIANAIGATVAPVGVVWSRTRRQHPGLSLHAEDGIHANAAGARLAASVILDTILGLGPRR